MKELLFINKILFFDDINYEVIEIDSTSDVNVLVTIQNDIYLSIIALVANETTINGVVQINSEMIVETLSN
jgi:hypothetical protein